jgi:hypothetical protein
MFLSLARPFEHSGFYHKLAERNSLGALCLAGYGNKRWIGQAHYWNLRQQKTRWTES